MGAQYTGPRGRNDESPRLAERLADGPPLVLDGAMGTELERRGQDCALPLWSARALLEGPELVRAIHSESVAAGARVLTANTFRTQRRTLRHAGLGDRAAELTTLAVALARDAAGECTPGAWVAGSAPPLEDCYRPDLAPARRELEHEHREHAALLHDAGVDLILVETHNTIAECLAAGRAAAETGLPWIASFVSWERGRLLSGESLSDALEAVSQLAPLAVGVNCLPPSLARDNLDVLRAADLSFCVSANLGAPTGAGLSEAHTPDEFAREALCWVAAGARLVGGCCGTTPAHVRAVAARLAPTQPATAD